MVVGLQRASTEAQERLVSEAPLMVKGAGQGPTRLRDRGDPGDIIPPPSVMGASALRLRLRCIKTDLRRFSSLRPKFDYTSIVFTADVSSLVFPFTKFPIF